MACTEELETHVITDDNHAHVRVVVKAMSEQGKWLNIRKATLRERRQDFARRLGEQGIAAYATDIRVRSVMLPRAMRRFSAPRLR